MNNQANIGNKKTTLSAAGVISIIGTILSALAAVGMMFLPMLSYESSSSSESWSVFDFTFLSELGSQAMDGNDEFGKAFVTIDSIFFFIVCGVALIMILCKALQKFFGARLSALLLSILNMLVNVAFTAFLYFALETTTALSGYGNYSVGIGLIIAAACSVLMMAFSIVGMFGVKREPAYNAPIQKANGNNFAVNRQPVVPAGYNNQKQPTIQPPMQPPARPVPPPVQAPQPPVQTPVQPLMKTSVPIDSNKQFAPPPEIQKPADAAKPEIKPDKKDDIAKTEDILPSDVSDNGATEFDLDPHTTVLMGCIEGISGDYKGTSIRLNTGEKIFIGRDPSKCNIVVNSETKDVSRVHCSVKYASMEDCYKVIDQSANGTFVNGKPLPKNQEVALPPDTIISLGSGDNKFKLGR